MARNKGGETGFQCHLSVIEKEQVVAPKFVERFTTIHVKQGEPVSLHARAVGTPIPKLTWQKDNALVTPGIYLQYYFSCLSTILNKNCLLLSLSS